MCSLPLSVKSYKLEYDYIKEIAMVNGYSTDIVDSLIKKHSLKIKRNSSATFFTQKKKLRENEITKYRESVSYVPAITNKLSNVCRNNKIALVFNSNYKWKNIVGSEKDKTERFSKSGIYSMECSSAQSLRYANCTTLLNRIEMQRVWRWTIGNSAMYIVPRIQHWSMSNHWTC